MNKDTASLIITVALAFLGYLVTYLNNIRLAQRAERLARVNRQLGELYGPLFSLSQASNRPWIAFRRKYRPGNAPFFVAGSPPTEEEVKAWCLWMKVVFMANNLRMYELVLSKSDLLIESEMPACLLDLSAHVAAYQTVMKKWDEGDFSELTSLINYPSADILAYTQSSFGRLKAEQARLIGKKLRR